MKESCRNCENLDLTKKTECEGRLKGRYRYGCSRQKSGVICGFLSCDDNLELLHCHDWSGTQPKKRNVQKISMEYGRKLQDMYDRWTLWKRIGSPEAEVPDGIYLNRIKRGIEHLLIKIESELPEEEYPDSYYAKVPPQMDEVYMANPEAICKAAKSALYEYENQEDYLWLSRHVHEIEVGGKEESEIYRLLCHADALREAIDRGDLLQMKRESRQEILMEDLAVCRKTIQEMMQKRKGKKSRKKSGQIIGQLGICELKAS